MPNMNIGSPATTTGTLPAPKPAAAESPPAQATQSAEKRPRSVPRLRSASGGPKALVSSDASEVVSWSRNAHPPVGSYTRAVPSCTVHAWTPEIEIGSPAKVAVMCFPSARIWTRRNLRRADRNAIAARIKAPAAAEYATVFSVRLATTPRIIATGTTIWPSRQRDASVRLTTATTICASVLPLPTAALTRPS